LFFFFTFQRQSEGRVSEHASAHEEGGDEDEEARAHEESRTAHFAKMGRISFKGLSSSPTKN